jgi:hypothetical protein
MIQKKTLLKKCRVLACIFLACLFLFACTITNQLQPVPKITFITATVGSPQPYPTIIEAIEPTLTHLPEQAYAMTQAALTTPDTHPRVEIITQTYTPFIIWTHTPEPSFTPLPATQSAEPSPTNTPKPTCRPEYPDFCVPYNNKRNCKDWNDLGHYNFTVLQPDPLRYDRVFDGLGCEG